MKISKRGQQLAKSVFKFSLNNGVLEESKIKDLTKVLVVSRTLLARQVLNSLEHLVEKYNSERQVVVESAFPLTESEREQVKAYFEKKLAKKLEIVAVENKKLISGIRIKLADNIWENSVVSNLDNLKGSFTL